MTLVAGIDLSTKAAHVAALTYDDPIRLWLATRPIDQADKGAERARNAGNAARDCLVDIQRQARLDITSCAVELPAGKFVHPSLNHAYGAICALVPNRIPVTGYAPSQWRKMIGAEKPNAKASGHEAVVAAAFRSADQTDEAWSPGDGPCSDRACFFCQIGGLDEHELDSVGIALAYRAMQWEAAA